MNSTRPSYYRSEADKLGEEGVMKLSRVISHERWMNYGMLVAGLVLMASMIAVTR
jgi:hypothetical protein